MVVAMANSGMPLSVHPPPSDQPPLIASNYIENGREYHGFRRGKYMFPCDEQEKDRMDIYHKFFLVARGEKLHSAPYVPNYDPGPRVLDLGTGTGIWAIDVADAYANKNIEVTGMDLTLMQPQMIPPGLTFQQRDFESPWHGMELDSWDLIHLRMLNGSVQNWSQMYQKIFTHLKPGYGWIEHVEIDIQPRCDDGTLPSDSRLLRWCQCLLHATQEANRPLAYNVDTRSMLERHGFVDIQEQVIQVPLNPWPSEPHRKDMGRWYNLGLTQGLEAMTLAPMMRVAEWPRAEVDKLIMEAKREICTKRIHAYNNMHIWIARRPATR